MQTLPPWLATALTGPYQLIPRIEWSPDWTTWFPLRPLSGSHGQNRTQQARWQFNGTFAKDYTVGEQGLHAYGPRARIFLGVKTHRYPVYWIPQGVYTITTAGETAASVSLSGSSFEQNVVETDFLTVRRIPDKRYMSYGRQAEILIKEAVPDARFYWDQRLNYTEPCPIGYFNTGRWGVIDGRDEGTSIMGAIGGEAYCDATGGFHFVPVPTLDDVPVWRVAAGGALVDQDRQFDREDVYNIVGAEGDSADGMKSIGPVYAWDADPTSVTYAGPNPVTRPGVDAGRFGLKPLLYSSALIDNEVQAGIAARALLANKLGLHYTLTLTARFHPGLEAGDVIEAGHFDGRRVERHLLDSLTYSWGAAEMSCEVRTPKEVYSSAALKRVNTQIQASDEIPLDSGGDSSDTGTNTPPPMTGGTGTVAFTALDGRSFQSDGDSRSTSHLYQGRYDTTNGNQKAMVHFNYTAIVAALTGKTVTGVSLKFRTEHAYYNAGMTAVIGTHNATSIATWNSTKTNRKQVSGQKSGEWHTAALGLTIAQEFAAGTAKGVVFGPGPSTSLTYYGYHYIASSKPVLTFSYST